MKAIFKNSISRRPAGFTSGNARPTRGRHTGALLALFIFFGLLSAAQAAADSNYPIVSACLPCPSGATTCVDAQADLVSQNTPIDSWYLVSNVKTPDGHVFNFMSQMMRYAVNALAVNSLTDAADNWYSGKEYDYPLNLLNASTQSLSVTTPDATLTGSYAQMHLTANVPGGHIDVVLTRQGAPLYNCNTGYFSELDEKTYEYALPSLQTTGTVTVNGVTYPVNGITWLDRQWVPMIADLRYLSHQFRWTWMNLNLSNGDFISLWDIVDDIQSTEETYATILHPDGTQQTVPFTPIAQNASDVWTSLITGQSYPTHFLVDIPSLSTRLEVTSRLTDQEIVSATDPKYEGASDVSGTYLGKPVTGYTYVELDGNWK